MQIFNYKTIDNMPLATDAAKVVSVREDVESWGCNPNKKKKAKAKLSGSDTRTADNKDGGGLEEFLSGVHANVAPNLAAPELRGAVGLGDQAD
jgi:hypothetical protein